MSIPMFDTRTLLRALEQMKPAKTFLRDTFFKNTTTFETANVDIDIYKGKRRTAAYVSPLEEGTVVNRLGYTTTTYTPPYIKAKTPTTAADILARSYNETIYSGTTPNERAMQRLAIDLTNLEDMVTRAEEVQAAQGLFTGSVTLRNNQVVDFGMSATHKISHLTNPWTNVTAGASYSNPLTDLRSWRRLLIQDSGIVPDTIIMGSTAIDTFLAHPEINQGTGQLSKIKVQLGQIDPQMLPNGATYWGYLSDVACDIYSYDEWYIPAGGSETAMVPVNKVFMGSSKARMDRLYGAIQDLQALYAVPRFAKSWEEEDPSVRWLMVESAPLLVPVQVDSFMFCDVIATS